MIRKIGVIVLVIIWCLPIILLNRLSEKVYNFTQNIIDSWIY